MNNQQIENKKRNYFHPSHQNLDHERLKILYGISKLLSSFESVDKTFPEILSLGAEGFPLLSAILIENWEVSPRTTVWHSEEATQDQVDYAIFNARKSYAFFSGSFLSQWDNFLADSPMLRELQLNKSSSSGNAENFIVLPLVISEHSPRGALQFQGAVELNEHDLEFVSALADLITVGLDRFYKTKKERELNEELARESSAKISLSQEKVTDLETERELRMAFISLLTHDLRTPLSAAFLSAQMIMRKADDPESCQSLASRIVRNINRADQMIENLLDANRIRSGEKLPLAIESFEMSELVKETLEELSGIHGDRFVLSSCEHIEGYWDRKGVRRIIENLCTNAIKYGSNNTPVTISIGQSEKDVQLSIINKGELILEKDQKFLFQQFRRGPKAQKSSKKGWGIGLTVVRGVAEAHGGSVAVESKIQSGTVFTVVLPKDARIEK